MGFIISFMYYTIACVTTRGIVTSKGIDIISKLALIKIHISHESNHHHFAILHDRTIIHPHSCYAHCTLQMSLVIAYATSLLLLSIPKMPLLALASHLVRSPQTVLTTLLSQYPFLTLPSGRLLLRTAVQLWQWLGSRVYGAATSPCRRWHEHDQCGILELCGGLQNRRSTLPWRSRWGCRHQLLRGIASELFLFISPISPQHGWNNVERNVNRHRDKRRDPYWIIYIVFQCDRRNLQRPVGIRRILPLEFRWEQEL